MIQFIMKLFTFWWQGIAGCNHYAVIAESEEAARQAVQHHIDMSDMSTQNKAQWPQNYKMEVADVGEVVEFEQQ